MVSIGDAASYIGTDVGTGNPDTYADQAIEDGIMKPWEDVGAYRAQLLNSYNGKILRIDPKTGRGIPGNPFYDPSKPDEPISKVWALGFRNPFRMALRPGTGSHEVTDANPGTLLIGDVGLISWEEINVAEKPGRTLAGLNLKDMV